jgi:hypothetical protein
MAAIKKTQPDNQELLMARSLRCSVSFVLLTLLTTACTSQTELISQGQQLGSSIDQCLTNQQQSAQLIKQQQGQIDGMMSQLSLIQLDVSEMAARALPVVEPPESRDACLPAETFAESQDIAGKMIVGQREQVWLQDLQLTLPARIDTGAETASLDARNIELFERNSRRWVRFEIVHPQSNEPIELELKLERMALIIQSNTTEPERRPVIKLGLTVGHISQSAEFTLSNRGHLDYQVLIGRNILQDVMVVDVSQQNIAPVNKET